MFVYCENCGRIQNLKYLPCGHILCDYCDTKTTKNKNIKVCPICTNLYQIYSVMPVEHENYICAQCNKPRPMNLATPCPFCELCLDEVQEYYSEIPLELIIKV